MKRNSLHNGLKNSLESLYRSYTSQYIESDPILFVHRYTDWQNQEIVGLLASSLAFGTVKQIKKDVETLLCVVRGNPFAYINNFNPSRSLKDFKLFTHRFVKGVDVACLLHFIAQVYQKYGSLHELFMSEYDKNAVTITDSLAKIVGKIQALDCSPFYADGRLPDNAGVRYLLCSPEKGSACKRMNLFLRWMVRRGDGIDLGIWESVSPAQLIIPLDTHVSRISRRLGLTGHRHPNWKMAVDITQSLRNIDREDPVKYDFAFSRLGILGICTIHSQKCRVCPLTNHCSSVAITNECRK